MSEDKAFSLYKGRNVLITGGLGFIGSNLARRLVEIGGVNVTILDSLVPDQGGNLYNINRIKDVLSVQIADMGDEDLIGHLVGGIDFIFNLAGSSSHIDSMLNPKRDLEFNCTAQLTMLEACRSFNPNVKIIYTSTRQVYGTPLYLPLDEHHRVSPIDVNGINKLAAEQYHLLYHRIYGLRTVCLRLTNTYGPNQLLNHNRHGFIGWFVRRALDDLAIELFGEGKQRRDVNFVDDVVDALLLAGASEDAEGEIFNLGSDEIVSLAELADLLIEIAGMGHVRSIPFPPERQSIAIGNAYSSYNKINNVLGWSPKTDLRTGLELTIDFYKENRDHYWTQQTDPFSRSKKAA